MSQILGHALTAAVSVALATTVSGTIFHGRAPGTSEPPQAPIVAPAHPKEPIGKKFLTRGARLAERFNIDVRSTIRVKDAATAASVRQAISAFIWPVGKTAHAIERTPDNSFSAIQTVSSTQKWTMTMRYGVVSNMYFLRSTGDSNCLFIYHEGHEPDPVNNVPFVRELATNLSGRGCDVLLMSMPLHGVNAQTELNVDGKKMTIVPNALHNRFNRLERPDFSPLSYFVDPVMQAIDEATRDRSYERIGLSGLSGGGWTTAFVGAIEPRLTHIYPVAGSMPFEMDIDPRLIGGVNMSSLRGDYEQSHQRFYRNVAGYFDLYLLGAMFPKRRAVHIYNLKDDCCFPGLASNAFAAQMTAMAAEQDASLRFVIDATSTRHEVSRDTADMIIESFTDADTR